jgi:pyruvate dehydrogenase E2 component (dihydrolipoamide acetyltransferase)
MSEFRMPSLGADMEAGTVVHWLVQPGAEVHKGDVVAVVDTDKADIDVEIFDSGRVAEILVPEGERVPVGTVLARLTPLEASVPAAPAPVATPVPTPLPPPVPVPAPVATPVPPPARVPAARRRASPRARRLAADLGVDLATTAGTGPGGAVTGRDVEQAPAAGATRGRSETGRSDTMRQAIARAMARSKREIPHYYLDTTIDFGTARAWLDAANAARPVADRLVPAALLLKASALALREVPELNGFWVDDAWRPSEHIHLGVAVSLREGGLLAPAIHDADTCTVDDLMRELRDLVNRARTGRLRSSELADATITVTNLGEQGVDAVYGVIFPPQVALLGFGAIRERPWASEGMLGVRPVVRATLAADHRATDGATGGRLLRAIDHALQRPAQL